MKNPLRLVLVLALLAVASCGDRTGGNANLEPPNTPASERAKTTAEEANTASEDLGPALISAVGRGDERAVRNLLQKGANVEARDGTGKTSLIAAAYGNHLEVARLLVEADADVNAKDDTEQSAYLISTSEVGDDPRLLDLTLQNGADVKSLDSYNGTGLIRAAERGYPKIVERLLRTDVNVDHVNDLEWTALLEAIILGDGGPSHIEVVRLLIQKGGADPNLPDGNGVTPLQHARQSGFTEIESILEKAGAG
jgi:uncharacterized protein